MKSTAAYLVSGLCAPSVVFALVGNSWSFSNAPDEGLNDITFPFNIANAPYTGGYYFAQQFDFNNVTECAYTGVQPRPDSDGESIIHAVFSSFENGTITSHPNCHYGADGGPGVSCAAEFPGDYSHTYNLVVENVGGTTWRGTSVDTVTGSSTVVGEWTLPARAGKIKNGQVGFVEYYEWNDGKPSHDCHSLPKTEATFFYPMSNTDGASGGNIPEPYEYGDCVGKVDFSATQVPSGWDIKVGF